MRTTFAATMAVAVALGTAVAHAEGDVARGERLFNQQCKACHTVEKDGASPVGPNLHGLFGRKAGRNALSSKQTCWSTVHVRTEQDAPDETRALGHALNSFSANDSRSVRRADGEWPSHPLVVCEGGAVASFAEDTLSVSTDTLHAQPLTDNVHGDAFVSVVAHCSCIRVEHNFYTA